MLKLLAGQGGRSIPVETLADTLWPDGEGAAAMDAFDVTLHRARKLLGNPAALLLHDAHLSLNPDLVWLDIGALGHATARIERGLASGAPELSTLANWSRLLTQLYPSPLLKHEPDSRLAAPGARYLAAAC